MKLPRYGRPCAGRLPEQIGSLLNLMNAIGLAKMAGTRPAMTATPETTVTATAEANRT